MDRDAIFIREVERWATLFEEDGLDPDTAYERAGVYAYDSAADILRDMADAARDLAKERH